MSFSGSGGPPPKQTREAGGSTGGGGQKPFAFRFYETLANKKEKKVNFIMLDKGEVDCPILILDEASPVGDEWQPSVYLHERFDYGGGWQNYAVCRCKTPEGCLLDHALQEAHSHAPWCKVGPEHGDDECKREGEPQDRKGSWRWVATAIKLKPYTFTAGKMKGKTIPYQRGLITAGEDQYKTLLTYRKAWGGLRGRLFHVSRGDGTFAPRIGDKWDPEGDAWSDEKMMKYFEAAAADYGLKPEDYIKAMDYEKILKLPTVAEMEQIAKYVAAERGVVLNLSDGTSTAPNPVAAAVGGEEIPEEDVPF